MESQVSYKNEKLRELPLFILHPKDVGEATLEILLVWAAHQAEPS